MLNSELEIKLSVKEHLHKEKVNLEEIAKDRIIKFSTTITKLLEHNKYDLVVAGGNSGVVFLYLTKLIYKQLDIKLPPTLVLPVSRDIIAKNERKHINDLVKISKEPEKPGRKVEKVLFVDDEIMSASTAKTCIEVVIENFNLETLDVTLVAENHGFEWHYELPISLKYYAYSKAIPTVNHAYAHLLKENDYILITKALKRTISRNDLWATLLDKKYKVYDKENDYSYFSNELDQELKNKLEKYSKISESLKTEIALLTKLGTQSQYENR